MMVIHYLLMTSHILLIMLSITTRIRPQKSEPELITLWYAAGLYLKYCLVLLMCFADLTLIGMCTLLRNCFSHAMAWHLSFLLCLGVDAAALNWLFILLFFSKNMVSWIAFLLHCYSHAWSYIEWCTILGSASSFTSNSMCCRF